MLNVKTIFLLLFLRESINQILASNKYFMVFFCDILISIWKKKTRRAGLQNKKPSWSDLMRSRKSVGSRMDPWGTPLLAGYSCEHFPSRTTWSSLLLRKGEIRPNILPEIAQDLSLKKTSLPNSVESLGYIMCFSSSSPTSSIRHNFQKIFSWSRRPKAILELRKMATFL